MALDELRAKDLAAIEPPGSITKIVGFAQQLSFGQEGLFAGVELPKPAITKNAFASEEIANQIASRPYAMFPGANGEGLDSLMSHYTVRPRDIQDFTKWLVRWNDVRTQLSIVESPELYFLRRATPQMIEAFQEAPEVQRVILEGRRRKRVVQEEVHGPEVEERRVRALKTNEVRAVEQGAESQEDTRPSGEEPMRARRGHPRTRPEDPGSRYWRDEPATEVKAVQQSRPIAPVEPQTVTTQAFVSSLGRGVAMSNLGFGSMSFGLIRGRSDMAASLESAFPDTQPALPGQAPSPFQAQYAASRAVQGSSVAPYMPHQPYSGLPDTSVGYSGPHTVHHYPQPEVYIREVYIDRTAPGSPFRATPSASPPPPPNPPQEYVIVSRQEAASSGLKPAEGLTPSPSLIRTAAAAVAATMMMPAFAGAASPAIAQYGGLPGFNGLATGLFAGQIAARTASAAPGQAMNPADALNFYGSAMPAGTLPRKDVFLSAAAEQAGGQPFFRGMGPAEPAVRTPIPNNPLLGQITLVSPPLQVASQESERAGTAVAFRVQDIARGAGPLDAAGLAMLQRSLPPGAQAIYPALPPGSLGPQAVNMSLAPSLLNQILSQGYGPQAGQMAGPIAASAAAAMPIGRGMGPMPASIVPTVQRPTDASAGVLGGKPRGAAGSLDEAGAGNAGRHGALDFLGMPVRLAPSLSGSADVKHESEARKVLPAGSAAILRPNAFGPLRDKVFPAMGTVNAEPDKSAWRHAAPSFGLRDAQPHTILSPDSRIKPPHAGAPMPQMTGGGQTPAARAIHAASAVAPALGVTGHAGLPTAAATHPISHGIPHADHSMKHYDGDMPVGGQRAFQGQAGPAAPSSFSFMPSFFSSPAPLQAGGSPSIGSASRPMTRFAAPGIPPLPSAAASGAWTSSRAASRFSPAHPSIGGGPTATVHDGSTSHSIHGHTMPHHQPGTPSTGSALIPMSRPGFGGSPGIPPVKSTSSGARGSSFGGFASPSMSRPATPTTARGGGYSAPSFSSSSSSATVGTPSPRSFSTSAGSSSSAYSRAPDMPIATSIPARGPQTQSATVIQRATHGGAVHANRTEHQSETSERSTNPQAQDPGASAHEINVLANEVWTLLKRKLLLESERLGKRY